MVEIQVSVGRAVSSYLVTEDLDYGRILLDNLLCYNDNGLRSKSLLDKAYQGCRLSLELAGCLG